MVHEDTAAECVSIALLRVTGMLRLYSWTAVDCQERGVHSHGYSIGNGFVGTDDVRQSICVQEGVHRPFSKGKSIFTRIGGLGPQHCCNTPREFVHNGRRLDVEGNFIHNGRGLSVEGSFIHNGRGLDGKGSFIYNGRGLDGKRNGDLVEGVDENGLFSIQGLRDAPVHTEDGVVDGGGEREVVEHLVGPVPYLLLTSSPHSHFPRRLLGKALFELFEEALVNTPLLFICVEITHTQKKHLLRMTHLFGE